MKKILGVIFLIALLFFTYSLGKRPIAPQLYEVGSRVAFDKKADLFTAPLSAPTPERTLELAGEIPEQSEEGGSISERLVIKTGWLSLLVTDVRGSVEQITRFAEDEGGFILSADVHKVKPESEQLIGLVKIKVPAERFAQIFERIKKLGLKVTSENVSGQDVTEEYTDLQSRLRNLEAAESQLLDLMKRAGKVTEILEVQRELVGTREQIEQTKGRVEFLEKSAKMATITINLATEEEELPVVEEGWRPIKVAKAALRALIRFWQRIGNLIIWSVIFFSPFVVLVGLILLLSKARKS